MRPRLSLCLFLAAATAVGLTAAPVPPGQPKAAPGDWPAWRGADRTGVSAETGLLRQWPAGGPKLLWKVTDLGGGYSTPSIAGGRIYVMASKGVAGGKGKGKGGSAESVVCLDANGGRRVWSTEIGATAGGYPGPRCTPTVDNGNVYALSSNGVLACLSADKGEVIWKKNFRTDFGGQAGGWAYTESPLIDGDRLVCTPGGTTATLVCLEKKTGNVIWKSAVTGLAGKSRAYSTAGYSSVVVARVAGVKQYVQFLAGGVVGVDASDGKLLWHYDAPANRTANISTPIVHDDRVFAATAYNTGGGLAKLTRNGDGFKAEEVYFLNKYQNHHGGSVLVGEHLYGTGGGTLMCISFKDGKVVWTGRGAGKGSVVYADGHLYHRGEDGTVCLVEATPAGFREKGRFSQPDRSTHRAWPHPVVAGGKLYLRDWDVLLCYDVKAN